MSDDTGELVVIVDQEGNSVANIGEDLDAHSAISIYGRF